MKIYKGGKWIEVVGLCLPNGQTTYFPLDFYADVAVAPLNSYFSIINSTSSDIVNDPILGATRKVIRVQASNDTTLDTGDPENKIRWQTHVPFVFGPGHDIWVGMGMLFPTAFPVVPTDGWMVLHEHHGAPFDGGSPNPLIILPGDKLAYHDFWTTPMIRDAWVDIAIHTRFGDATHGFVEIWMNTGSGWMQQTFKDGSQRKMHATIDKPNLKGPNGGGPKHYRKRHMWPGVVTNYFAEYRIGSSLEEVKPHSY